jgi:hypothetical protein
VLSERHYGGRKVPAKSTKLVYNIRNKSYEDRLKYLNLFTLERKKEEEKEEISLKRSR